MTEFITRNHGNKDFEIIIKTDSREHYKATEDFARRLIDHAKPQADADCEFCNDTLKRFPYILATSDTGDCGTVFEPAVCPKCGRRLQQPAEEGS